MSETATAEHLKRQVNAYRIEKAGHYDLYARVLKRTLERACGAQLPEAFVQARPKSVDSFAEKCVRKFSKYPDAVNQMDDLCGARVIVQTLDQVAAVRAFIKSNFFIKEEDEKGAAFADNEFGYRDVHYVIKIRADRCFVLGIDDAERDAIGARSAEIQVRTWLQHAWADTLHDRMYKTKLKYPREFRRIAGLLAAQMEDGDRAYGRLTADIDGMLANFNAYASREDVTREIAIQRLVIDNSDEKTDRVKCAKAALQLARLLAAQGQYEEACKALQPYDDTQGSLRPEILMDLGYALCRCHRSHSADPRYVRGLDLLREAVTLCEGDGAPVPQNLRRRNSLYAKALARTAWALEPVRGRAAEARACYQAALEHEPGNPYYLTDVIGHEINWLRKPEIVGSQRAAIRIAQATCREHMENGTEMPYACFTAGRLHLLLGEALEALNCYALGIAHITACVTCLPPDVLDAEEEWILRVVEPEQPQGGYAWALQLLALARRAACGLPEAGMGSALRPPVLVLAGGAGSLSEDDVKKQGLVSLLERALAGFTGTVLSGGTRCGIPGCAGAVAESLGAARAFRLVGYRPASLPDNAQADTRYDLLVQSGEAQFTPEQIFHYWEDLFDAGVDFASVRLLGYGGGALSTFEYRLALALGVTAGIVEFSGGAADALSADPLWSALRNLIVLPCDPDTLRAFVQPADGQPAFAPEVLDRMARAFHANYVAGSVGKLPSSLKPWEKLDETFRTANREQARYAVKILEACGFTVRSAADPDHPVVLNDFTDAEVERMAELEHGRWNAERLRDGWRHGPRDDAKKRHNCLVPWRDDKTLTAEIKDYDRNSVRKFPEILAQAGLEIVRR